MTKQAFMLGLNRQDTLPPTFFIGLGGSGGRVVDILAQRLRAEAAWPKFSELVHFITIDTDQGDLDRLIKRGHVVSNISVSSKPDRVKGFRGEIPGIESDEKVTSWVHDWYNFRAASSKGAGQIRLESRFSLYCQLREGKSQNVRSLIEDRLSIALRSRNANTSALPEARFFLYGSLAGGTGSGANLSVAYLCRRLAASAGLPDIGISVFGCFFLPSLFRKQVGAELINSINSNGYAALKEIEHLMELRYRNAPSGDDQTVSEEYVHDPRANPTRKLTAVDSVTGPPFNWVYLIDEPEGTTIDPSQVYRAVGEVALLQMFSPILRKQDSANDNFEKLQMDARNGYFAVQYGSFGAAVVELPRAAMTAYFARLASIDVMERMIVGRGGGEAADKLEKFMKSKEFQELSDAEQNRMIDQSFCQFIEHQADREMKRTPPAPGMFSQIKSMEPTEERNLVAEFEAELKGWHDDTSNELKIGQLDALNISEENPSIDSFYGHLIQDFKKASTVISKAVAAIETRITDGVFDDLFSEVSPLMQRYFLVQMNDRGAAIRELLAGEGDEEETEDRSMQWCLLPGGEDDDGYVDLARAIPTRADYDPEASEIKKLVQDANRRLQDAARTSFQGRRDRAMNDARLSIASSFNNDVVDTIRVALMQLFWRDVMRILRKELGVRLGVYRGMAKAGLGAVSRLQAEAERSRRAGTELGSFRESFAVKDRNDADDRTFHLGTAVLCDHRSNVVLWDHVYRLCISQRFDQRLSELILVVNERLTNFAKEQGAKAIVGQDILIEVMEAIDNALRDRMTTFLKADATGIDFIGGLELEARIRLATTPLSPLPDATQVNGIPDNSVQSYIEDKLSYAIRMSAPLARFDRAMVAGGDLAPYEPQLCGVPVVKGVGGKVDEPGQPEVSRAAIERKTAGFQAVEDWQMPDLMTFYQGVLGLPLYAWADVEQSLMPSYSHEVSRVAPTPLHTDQRYEPRGFHTQRGLGLPDLSIAARMRWEADSAELLRQQAEQGLRRKVVLLMAAGVINKDDGAYFLAFAGAKMPLGARLCEVVPTVLEKLRTPEISRALLAQAGTVTASAMTALCAELDTAITLAAFASDDAEAQACRELRAAVADGG